MDANRVKIETYTTQFYSALDDYKRADISRKLNPEVEQYQDNFAAAEASLTAVNKNVFVLSNDIQSQTDNLNVSVGDLNEKIAEQRDEWKKLGFDYQQVKGVGGGADLMVNNSRELYKTQYVSNWCMFVGIFLIALVIYLFFGKKNAAAAAIPHK